MAQEKSLVIIDSDDSTRGMLAKLVGTLPNARVAADSADFAHGLRLVRQTRPAMVVVEVADEEQIRALERLHLELPAITLLVSCKDTSREMVLKCVRAGAQEFLERPVKGDEAGKAIERLLRTAGGASAGGSKLIAVFSNKGGTGTSTLAVNLAVALAQVTGQGVALADFDTQAGEVSLFLDARPTRTLADLAASKTKLDSAVVQSALVKHPSGVYVLCGAERPEQNESIGVERLHEILEHLTGSFPYVVCDLTHSFSDASLEVFDNARHILVLTLLNLPAIRSARRCLHIFRELNYLRDEDKVRLVVNRYLPNKDIDVSQLEETLRFPVYWKIPNDYATVIDAVNTGTPIQDVNPDSEVARSLRKMAADLAGLDEEAADTAKESGGLFGKLLGRKR